MEAPFHAESVILGLRSLGVALSRSLKSPITRMTSHIPFSLQKPAGIKIIIVETGQEGVSATEIQDTCTCIARRAVGCVMRKVNLQSYLLLKQLVASALVNIVE